MDHGQPDAKATAAALATFAAVSTTTRSLLQADDNLPKVFGGSGTRVAGGEVRRLQHRFMSVQWRITEATQALRRDIAEQRVRDIERSRLMWIDELSSRMHDLGVRADLWSWPAQGWAVLDDDSVEWLTYFDNYLTSIDNSVTGMNKLSPSTNASDVSRPQDSQTLRHRKTNDAKGT